MAQYVIAYVGMYDWTGEELTMTDGYNAHDYLDDYDELTFDCAGAANEYLVGNHRGPDVDGITARFVVIKA